MLWFTLLALLLQDSQGTNPAGILERWFPHGSNLTEANGSGPCKGWTVVDTLVPHLDLFFKADPPSSAAWNITAGILLQCSPHFNGQLMWSCSAQIPRFNLGHLWKTIPAPGLYLESAEASITATLQTSSYLWPILPSHLPYRPVFHWEGTFPNKPWATTGSQSGTVSFQRTQSKACW